MAYNSQGSDVKRADPPDVVDPPKVVSVSLQHVLGTSIEARYRFHGAWTDHGGGRKRQCRIEIWRQGNPDLSVVLIKILMEGGTTLTESYASRLHTDGVYNTMPAHGWIAVD